MPPRPATFERSWFYRRWAALTTLFWCAGMVTYLGIWGRDLEISETIANGCLLLMGSVIGAYIFGSTWDDRNKDQAILQETKPPQPGTVDEEVSHRRRVVTPPDPPVDPDPPAGFAQ